MAEQEPIRSLESVVTERLNPQSGLVEKLPLLHSSSCTDVSFLPYLPPIKQNGGELDPLWVEAIQELDSDLHWLLRLPHANFWSQVVYDSSLQKCLDSYLRNAPRSYDRPFDLPLKVKETLRNIHKRVFMTFLRISASKESEAHYLSPTAHADLIYQHYLFDIPKLMDLCTLYSSSNQLLLSKMVADVFKVQPKYKEDWSLAVLSFVEILKKVTHKVVPGQGAVLLCDQPKTLLPDELSDLLVYLSDITATLKSFLLVFPPAMGGLTQRGFLESLVNFYESVVPVLQKQWLTVSRDITDAQYVKSRFRQFKKDSAWIVNGILRLYLDPTPSDDITPSSQISLDDFITAVSTVFTEKFFLCEFRKHYSLASLVQEMQRSHPDLPESHFNYIISSLEEPHVGEVTEKSESHSSTQGLVSHVKELLPHLGEGFIELCLKEFGNSPETVVDRVLQGNLPPHLKQADQSMSAEDARKRSSQPKATNVLPPGKGSPEVAEKSLLEQRENVFNNDEFDVFRKGNSLDLSRVHIGKKFEATSTLLDDKTHLADTRETYRQYENETPWTYNDFVGDDGMSEMQIGMSRMQIGMSGMQAEVYEFDQYSDEYDDTYDSHLVGAADNDSSEELFVVKRLNDKGEFSRHFSQYSKSTENDEPQSGASHVTSGPGHVTILKRPSNESKPKTSSQSAPSPHKHKSPKGQSSKGSVEVKMVEGDKARQMKEKNKAKRANHNRKAMADKKRARGMGAPPRQ